MNVDSYSNENELSIQYRKLVCTEWAISFNQISYNQYATDR